MDKNKFIEEKVKETMDIVFNYAHGEYVGMAGTSEEDVENKVRQSLQKTWEMGKESDE